MTLAVMAATALWGCAATGRAPRDGAASDNAAQATRNLASPRPADSQGAGGERDVVAIVAGQPVTLSQLAPALLEAAGGQALEEIALDVALRAQLRDAGLAVADADIDTEREALLARFAQTADSQAAPGADARESAEAALTRVRLQRGLGPARFRALLWRTAALRALVRRSDPVTITDDAIAQAHEMAHGPTRIARVIVAPDLAQAQVALRRVNAGEPFSQVAVEMSSDLSAARGGLLEPISLADPSYPSAIRDALASLAPGQRSPPVAIDSGYAIFLLERIEPGDGVPLEQTRDRLTRDLTIREERVRMDRLAQRLLRQVDVRPLDATLERAWRERATGRR